MASTEYLMYPHKLESIEQILDNPVLAVNNNVAPGDYVSDDLFNGNWGCEYCMKNLGPDDLLLDSETLSDKGQGIILGWIMTCADCQGLLEDIQFTAEKEANVNMGSNSGKPPLKPTSLPVSKPASTSPYVNSWGGSTWYQSCPNGHNFRWKLGAGALVLASWRGKDGRTISGIADACIFFDKLWENTWQPDVRVYPGSDGTKFPFSIDESARDLPPLMMIDWPDGGEAPVEAVRAAKQVAELIKAGKNIEVGCHGGHGRTGTFAALVLLFLGEAKTGWAAIKRVWKDYCEEAIETTAQERGIINVATALGLPVGDPPATPAKAPPSTPITNYQGGD